MKFKSEADRMKNSLARRIPKPVWDKYFHNELTNSQLDCMRFSIERLKPYLQEFVDDSDDEKMQAWICCAYREPALTDNELLELSKIMQLPVGYQCVTAAIVGRDNITITIYNTLRMHTNVKGHGKVLSLAARMGDWDVMEKLIQMVSNVDRKDMIAENDYSAFRVAVDNGHQHVVNNLLAFPGVFAYAQKHQDKYQSAINVFIENKLETLYHRASVPHPTVVVTQQEAQLCLHMAQYLMNMPKPLSDETEQHIRFLMTIPVVQSFSSQKDQSPTYQKLPDDNTGKILRDMECREREQKTSAREGFYRPQPSAEDNPDERRLQPK